MHRVKLLLLSFIIAGTSSLLASQLNVNQQNGWRSLVSNSTSPDTSYAFSEGPRGSGQYDRNADGKVDLVVSDKNHDGRADYWATDRNFDGRVDDYQYDRNLDGRIDQWEYDIDHDGVSDKIYVDGDGDGKAEMYATLNPITRTYTWYGNMASVNSANQVAFPALSSVKSYATGKVGDSQ